MAWHGPLNRIDDWRVEIPASYQSKSLQRLRLEMKAPGLIYADEEMLRSILADDSLEQVVNVATLPGIVGASMAMPDIHHGYGFPIGGVAAFDASDGIISPGGVGYDINCGVRLLRSDLTVDDIRSRVPQLIDQMFQNVPCGVGSEGSIRLSVEDTAQVLRKGSRWAVENGYGWPDDIDTTEDGGCIRGGEASVVSETAKKRGKAQLGTLGAGNHFLEIQMVDEIFDQKVAETFGIFGKGQIITMIHTGSRGLGHQVCTDFLEVMRRANKKYGIPLVDRELACAPASSIEGQDYFAAMKCGANYAWANRQVITHFVRQAFESVLGQSSEELGLNLIYDIAHNIAKLEEHNVAGEARSLYVHRKGATRAFGPGHEDVPERYRSVGQPVLIPGDMGTASYLLVGTEQAMQQTFGSSCHGAGRARSRMAARKKHRPEEIVQLLRDRGIYLQAKSKRVIAEEAPDAYKDVNRVVEVSHQSGIARKVARLKPLGVAKG